MYKSLALNLLLLLSFFSGQVLGLITRTRRRDSQTGTSAFEVLGRPVLDSEEEEGEEGEEVRTILRSFNLLLVFQL